MPRIPLYDGPQVAANPLPGPYSPRIDVSSGQAALGEGVERLGAALEEKQKKDTLETAFVAEQRLGDAWNQWQTASQPKYTGENAKNYEADANAWWDKAKDQYSEGLNPMVKKALALSLLEKRNAALGNVRNFAMAEGQKYSASVFENTAISTIDFAVENNDPLTGVQQLNDQVTAYADAHGMGAEWTAATKLKMTTRLHANWAEKLSETDGVAAEKYLTDHSAEIEAETEKNVRKSVGAEADKQWAASFANGIANLTYGEQIAKVDQITDVNRRERAEAEVNSNYARAQRVIGEGERLAAEEVYRVFNANGRPSEAMLQRMDPLRAASVRAAIDARDRTAGKPPADTNWDVYQTIMDMEPEKLAQMDIGVIMPHLASAERGRIKEKWEKAREGGHAASGMVSDEQMMKDTLRLAGLTPSSTKNKEQQERASRFRTVASEKVIEEQERLKRDLSDKEKRAVLDAVAMDVVYEKGFWGGYSESNDVVVRATATEAELKDTRMIVNGKPYALDYVPPMGRARVTQYLRKRGIPVTETNILAEYLRVEDHIKKQRDTKAASDGPAYPDIPAGTP